MKKPCKYRISGSDDLMRWSDEQQAYLFITTLKGRTMKQAIKDYEELELVELPSEDEG